MFTAHQKIVQLVGLLSIGLFFVAGLVLPTVVSADHLAVPHEAVVTPSPLIYDPLTGQMRGSVTYDDVTPAPGVGGVADPTASPPASIPAETPITVVGDDANPILRILHTFVTTFFGWLVTIAGVSLDYAIKEFTIGFGAKFETSHLGFTVNNIWGTVRDIFNLTFIFGLVYIGFKMILDSSDSSARKMLISLIGAALLVNFSLFITKFVIDFSNIAALKVYEAFQNVSGLPVGSIGTAFMTLMGVSGILDVSFPDSGLTSFAYVFGLMIVLMVLAYVFFAAAILLIIRFVVLNIYMIFSPIMFLGWVFPSMAGQSQKYWSGFLNQSFFAPAFLFMIYLSYRVTESYNDGLVKNFSDVFTVDGDIIGIEQIIPFFAMTIVFLIASMMVAKKMGAVGADSAISVGQKMRKSAQGIMYRNTGGRLAKGTMNIMDRTGASNLYGGRMLRSSLASAYKYGAGGSSLAQTRSDIESHKADVTKYRSGVAAEKAEARLAAQMKYANSTNSSKRIKFEQAVSGASNSQLITQLRKFKPGSAQYNKIVGAMTHSQYTKIMESKDDEYNQNEKNALYKTRGTQVEERLMSAPIGSAPGTARTAIETAIERDASAEDLKSMGLDKMRTYAENITAAKMDDLKKILTPTEYGILKKDRDDKLIARSRVTVSDTAPINSAVFKKADGVTGKKDSELARLPSKIIADPRSIDYLTSKALEIALHEEYISPSERSTIRNTIMALPGPTAGVLHPLKEWLTSTSAGKTF